MASKHEEEYCEGTTRFEKARIIGARALQISMGAPMLLKLDEKDLEKINFNPIEIAKMEYDKNIIPLKIKRVSLKITP